MGTLLIGIVIEFIILIGCLAFGYTLGIYFPYKNDIENIKNKNEIIKIIKEALDMVIQALEQEPCEDAISRQAVLNALYALCDTGETLKENPWRDNLHIDAVVETIEELPPVTPQSKMGQWIAQNIYNCHTDFRCSECGYIHSFMHIYGKPTADYTYCPNCGARMVES